MRTSVHAPSNAPVAPVSSFTPVRSGVLQRCGSGPCDCDVHDDELLQRSAAEGAERAEPRHARRSFMRYSPHRVSSSILPHATQWSNTSATTSVVFECTRLRWQLSQPRPCVLSVTPWAMTSSSAEGCTNRRLSEGRNFGA
jgi:hypothetical protein